MKLKEWMDFNKPFIDWDLQIVLLKYGSYHKDNTLFEGIINWDIGERLFGDYEIKKVTIGKGAGTDFPYFRLFIWDHPNEFEKK